jgi:hypothetical protein
VAITLLGNETIAICPSADKGHGATLVDHSGNGLHATIVGATWRTSDGRFCIDNRNGQYCIIPNNAVLSFGTNEMAASMWVFCDDDFSTFQQLWDKGFNTGNGTRTFAGIRDTTPYFRWYTANTITDTADAATLDKWMHICVTRRGANKEVWLNGTRILNIGYATGPSWSNADSLVIGARSDVTANFLRGYWDDFRIWNGYAPTDAEIAWLATARGGLAPTAAAGSAHPATLRSTGPRHPLGANQ